MEVSALRHSGAVINGRSPLLRLQGDEKLVALIRRGNHHAFEALVARYQSRLLAFCRHMLGSREDAEDVLQEVFAAAFNAMLADEREINVRPWLYRIARNRSLNHLRRTQAVGVDSMDVHLSEGGITTADRVHKREEFRLLIADVQDLPETQRTALLLREIDALSYEQIAEAMETTVPSVKSLLVRARVSLAEAAEARQLSCDEVRLELGAVSEGLRKTTAPVRRHLRTCERCQEFRKQLRHTNRALAALYPIGPLVLLKKSFVAQLGGATAAGGGAASTVAGAGATAGALQTAIGALGAKAAAGLAAAALVTAGAVEVKHVAIDRARPGPAVELTAATPATPTPAVAPAQPAYRAPVPVESAPQPATIRRAAQDDAAAKRPKGDAAAAEPKAAERPPAAAEAEADGAESSTVMAAAPETRPAPERVQREESTTTLATGGSPTGTGGAIGPEEPSEPQTTSAPPSQGQPTAGDQQTASSEPQPAAQQQAGSQPAQQQQQQEQPAASGEAHADDAPPADEEQAGDGSAQDPSGEPQS